MAGFIGSHLAARLIGDGHEVVGLDNLSDGSLENLKDVPEIEFVEGDLRDDRAVSRAARGCLVIFHQGAMRSVPRSLKTPGLTTDVNVRGTLNVLITAHAIEARVISASSSSVYGDQSQFPLHEAMELKPRSPYAASKAAGEMYCRAWWDAFRVPTISLRYFNVYGPGQDPTNEYAAVVPLFILACLSGSRPTVHGDGSQSRDFTFIDDVVEANVLAARAGHDAFGKAINVGGGHRSTSINELLSLAAETTGTRPDPIHVDPRPGDVMRTEADITRAGTLLGYQPRTPIRRGIELTIDWFRAHPPVLVSREG